MKRVMRKKYLDPAKTEEVVAEINRRANAAQVPVALIGGLAMQIYGSDRLTADVDFVAADTLGLPGPSLSFGGVQALVNGVEVDLVVRSDDYASLYEAALTNALPVDGGGLVVAPEYLAAMKMVAGRPKDMLDLDFLITSGQLDVGRTSAVLATYLGRYAVTEFKAIWAEALWRAGKS